MAIRAQPLAVMFMGIVLATPIDASESIIGVPKIERNIESESARNSIPKLGGANIHSGE